MSSQRASNVFMSIEDKTAMDSTDKPAPTDAKLSELLLLFVVVTVLSAAWLVPRVTKILKIDSAFADATALEVKLHQYYQFESPVPKSDKPLPLPPAYRSPQGPLHDEADALGIVPHTWYPSNSAGYALALANKVLTGSSKAVLVDLSETPGNVIDERQKALIASVHLLPWR